MTITPSDISDLHEIMPDPQAVTYRRAQGDGSYGTATVDGAERRPLGQKEIATGEFMPAANHIVWCLWTSRLGGVVPKIGDKLRDSSDQDWSVKSIALELLGQRFCLVCAKDRVSS